MKSQRRQNNQKNKNQKNKKKIKIISLNREIVIKTKIDLSREIVNKKPDLTEK